MPSPLPHLPSGVSRKECSHQSAVWELTHPKTSGNFCLFLGLNACSHTSVQPWTKTEALGMPAEWPGTFNDAWDSHGLLFSLAVGHFPGFVTLFSLTNRSWFQRLVSRKASGTECQETWICVSVLHFIVYMTLRQILSSCWTSVSLWRGGGFLGVWEISRHFLVTTFCCLTWRI